MVQQTGNIVIGRLKLLIQPDWLRWNAEVLPAFGSEALRQKSFGVRKNEGIPYQWSTDCRWLGRWGPSSPVRIPATKDTLEHPPDKMLFPCRGKAGYAGGIVSAAMDGEERCAEAALHKLWRHKKALRLKGLILIQKPAARKPGFTRYPSCSGVCILSSKAITANFFEHSTFLTGLSVPAGLFRLHLVLAEASVDTKAITAFFQRLCCCFWMRCTPGQGQIRQIFAINL